jgi:hypothetical protein
VAIGEIPEIIVYRDPRGTFTRSVTITFGISVIIMLVVHGQTTLAVPFYGVGVFLPIMVMGLAIRQHVLKSFTGWQRRWGAGIALFAAVLSGVVFIGQIVGKWEEGGWVRLISFTTLFTLAHIVLISPAGYREPKQIHRIVRDKARVQGAMASIVEWQSLKMQEYRYWLLLHIVSLFSAFHLRNLVSYMPGPAPVVAGDYDHALHVDHPDAPSLLAQYMDAQPVAEPHVGGKPNVTAAP